jgi:hypothetical protein
MTSVTIMLNERQIYELDWLEECYKKVRFPNPKCEDFLVEINKTLSYKIRGELDNQVKQQALFKLLGEDYVRIHFPHHKFNLALLEPPKTKPEIKKAYIEEMKQLVQEQLVVTLKECGYPEDVSEYEPKKPTQLSEFLQEVKKVFKKELDGQMADATTTDRIRDIELDAISAAGDMLDQPEPANDFKPSQVPGEGFVAAAKHSDQVAITALKVFKSKAIMFPMPMRKFLWEDYIYSNRIQGDKRAKSLQQQRKEFKDAVQKKIKPGQMNRAVQSPDVKLIYSVIIDSYETTKVMKPIAEDDHMLAAAHVLNVINMLDKYYSNAQIFWLLPLQLVYPRDMEEKQEDYIIRLSNHLHLFSRFCAMSWKEVFGVAHDILEVVKKQDKEYYNHLKRALGEKITPVDVYDFAYEILHKETKKSTHMWQDLYKKKKKDVKDRDLEPFGDPEIYLRKWISEGFAGIFGGQNLLYIWDFCFMSGWTKKTFQKIGLVVLMMIKPWAMQAETHRKMSKVLFDEPSNLYIGDLRKAFLAYKECKEDCQKLVEFNTNALSANQEEKPETPEEKPEEKPAEKPEEKPEV